MARGEATRISDPVRYLGLAFVGFFLFSIFIVTGFPYDRLAEFIAAEVDRSLGLRIEIGDLGPTLQLAGPGIRAIDVNIEAGGFDYQADRATLRPAWSTSWLRGRPAIHADIEGPMGAIVGTYTMDTELGWEGVLKGIDLEAPAFRQLFPTVQLTGYGDADLEVKQSVSGPEGWVRFTLTDGSIAFGSFPLAVPFETVTGSMTLGVESFATIDELNLDGPLMSADATGSIKSAPRLEEAELDLKIQIQAQSDLQIPLESAGVRFDKDGSARVRVSGTALQPIIH